MDLLDIYIKFFQPLTMKVRIKKSDFIRWYLKLFNGFLGLSNREILILEELIKQRELLSSIVTQEDVLNSQLFSSTSRKSIRETCKINSENLFNNYFSSLKKKGVIEQTNNGYKLSDKILPNKKVTFEVEFINE